MDSYKNKNTTKSHIEGGNQKGVKEEQAATEK